MPSLQQVATELFLFKEGRQSEPFLLYFTLLTQHYYHVLDSLSSYNRIEEPSQCDSCPAGLSVQHGHTPSKSKWAESFCPSQKYHRTHNRLILFLFLFFLKVLSEDKGHTSENAEQQCRCFIQEIFQLVLTSLVPA